MPGAIRIKYLCFLLIFWVSWPSQVFSVDCLEAQKYYQQGIALSNNSEQEIASYKKAIELCPEYAEALTRLGNVYKARQEWGLAVPTLERACATSIRSEPYTSLGEVYRGLGQYDLAVQQFQTALDINPTDKQALANLEYIYRTIGRYDEGFYDDIDSSLVPTSIFGREPGFTLPRGVTHLDFNIQSIRMERDLTSPYGTVVNMWKLTTGIRYGLRDNVTIGIIPKLFWKKAYSTQGDMPGTVVAIPSVYGLGDTMILLKYCLWYHRKSSLAAALNISLPTGDERKILPLGSGKYEFIPSLAFSTNLWSFNYLQANVQYFHNRTKVTYLDPGYEIRYNLGFSHFIPLLGTTYLFSVPITGAVAQIEINGVYMGKTTLAPTEIYGPTKADSLPASNTIFFSPGVQLLLYPNLKFELGLQWPAIVPDQPWIKEPVYHIGLVKLFF